MLKIFAEVKNWGRKTLSWKEIETGEMGEERGGGGERRTRRSKKRRRNRTEYAFMVRALRKGKKDGERGIMEKGRRT